MLAVFDFVINLALQTLRAVLTSLAHNWWVLTSAILLAVILKTYVNSNKLSKSLLQKRKISIFASVLFGAFTPLCACGTTAVLIGMLTTTLPWGPIMAFLTSSPLMSPDGFVLLTGVIGLRFAIALTVASVAIGISSGFLTNLIEKRTDFLTNQSRFTSKEPIPSCACMPAAKQECACSTPVIEQEGSCVSPAVRQECSYTEQIFEQGCSCNLSAAKQECACASPVIKQECSCAAPVVERECCCDSAASGNEIACVFCDNEQVHSGNHIVNLESVTQYCCEKIDTRFEKFIKRYKIIEFRNELYNLGLKQILLFYSIFVAVGYLINYFVPQSIITVLFGANTIFAVPLAALIGLPLYITTDSGIPIIQSMLQSGASEGAMLAFMITGSATSAWVIAGLATFLKKRAVILYVLFVMIGGILSGYVLDIVCMFL